MSQAQERMRDAAARIIQESADRRAYQELLARLRQLVESRESISTQLLESQAVELGILPEQLSQMMGDLNFLLDEEGLVFRVREEGGMHSLPPSEIKDPISQPLKQYKRTAPRDYFSSNQTSDGEKGRSKK